MRSLHALDGCRTTSFAKSSPHHVSCISWLACSGRRHDRGHQCWNCESGMSPQRSSLGMTKLSMSMMSFCPSMTSLTLIKKAEGRDCSHGFQLAEDQQATARTVRIGVSYYGICCGGAWLLSGSALLGLGRGFYRHRLLIVDWVVPRARCVFLRVSHLCELWAALAAC